MKLQDVRATASQSNRRVGRLIVPTPLGLLGSQVGERNGIKLIGFLCYFQGYPFFPAPRLP